MGFDVTTWYLDPHSSKSIFAIILDALDRDKTVSVDRVAMGLPIIREHRVVGTKTSFGMILGKVISVPVSLQVDSVVTLDGRTYELTVSSYSKTVSVTMTGSPDYSGPDPLYRWMQEVYRAAMAIAGLPGTTDR
jgi:hypothetical protein